MSFNTISVVGLGYIGLPTAAMFASRKKKVIGVDVNQHAVDTINRGEIHIVEPELDMIVHAAVKEGYLKATLSPEQADAFLIAVPTPFKNNDSQIPEPDLTYIHKASEAIAPVLKKGDLVILESTSPVGATEQMAGWLAAARPDLSFPQQAGENADVNIAHCPERVLPGHVVRELVENDRVIGGMTANCSARAVELYKTFVQGECVITNARTAEMAKLTENSCRDVQIAFANELSIICDKLDINVWELISLANRHPRINILQPGPGVGGHCIAVDPWFIVNSVPDEAKIIKQARFTNDAKPQYVIEKVKAAAKRFSSPTIACLGLTFKADIDDLRESPALLITNELAASNIGKIIAVEPNVKKLPDDLNELGVKLMRIDDALYDAHIAVVLVDHKEFKEVSANSVLDKVVIDTKGIWSKK
ncbi:UDP-N-acetyl-D-mannosamine dehydrogenase [Pseudoalteromonas sp. Isolate6]|uniref:UDP-N-acetyl-D-mannosamine dehydrogenase n=1 Tax=Pseudoalteromonas sp. Isolate6 TaxID=2908527 RepID=UPI001EFC78E2|nr:UDP-N-acetyl-D-mannosamine dehydrogenase [Pseudoalteromonas sp. Isolate6]MCG9761269.1 UDP-N-acetyl-D-mannosamine dehydrogenase [Pseudoalteromonas sp. Isolate6]